MVSAATAELTVAPVAAFSGIPTSGTTPLTVAFTDESTGTGPLTYAWDFTNDGSTDNTSQSPSFIYINPGNFTVNLTVTGPGGSDSEVKTEYITVTTAPIAPVAAFSGIPTSGTDPLTVAFTDQSTGTGPFTYAWDFDNNGVADSTLQNPLCVYASAGNFTVNLTVTGPGGSDSEVKTSYITVTTAPIAPVAAFSGTPTSGTAPLTVAFTDESTGTGPFTYAWDFTNDGTIDSTSQNPLYNYPSAGTYTVNLTVTGPGGSDFEIKTNYISVAGTPASISAQFKASPQTGFAPLAVQFTDQSSGAVTSYAWDFNNDGRTDSTWQNPAHYFLSTGNFTIKLIVRGPEGTDEEVKYNYINVLGKQKAPIAKFSRNPRSGSAPLSVQFTDHTQNDPDTYVWSFGDGATSSEKNPSHTYTVPGTYKVSLLASNEAGSSTISGYVYVINVWNFRFTR